MTDTERQSREIDRDKRAAEAAAMLALLACSTPVGIEDEVTWPSCSIRVLACVLNACRHRR